MNVQIMIEDAAKVKDPPKEDDEKGKGEVVHRELKTKEDIKNYIKGII